MPMPAVSSTTIGVGVHAGHSDSDTYFDATQAAVLALKDALDRSNLKLSLRSNIQVLVKLGIPAEPQSPTTPMAVDMGRLAQVLPSSVTVAPMSMVVGGLFCPGGPGQELSLCSVVACLTVLHAERGDHASTEGSQMSPVPEARAAEVPVVASTRGVLLPRATLPGSPMDMLAQISEEVQEKARIQQEKQDNRGGVAYPRILHLNHHIHQAQEGEDSSLCVDGSHRDDLATEKKLRVVIASNELQSSNVPHSYTDHTRQRYTPDDAELVLSGKAYNTAFPVKLHDALTEIEADGKEHIVSWQPHGRAFKIHNQEAFEDEILPKYFVMTKKTSFLRQLNLYGFHRLSGGLDKGGYYHELFLRGMPFLSRRMRRQKINGKLIRAATNPAQDPDFYIMPAVRPVMKAFSSSSISMTESSSDDPDDGFIEEGSAGITSVIKMVPSRAHNHVSFPLKLYMMLDTLDAQGNRDVISWMPHGQGFIVHRQDAFATDIMPRFFRQTKFSSFQRQLKMYSFQRISRGENVGGYYHSCFLRGRPELCQSMSRTSINGKGWHTQAALLG